MTQMVEPPGAGEKPQRSTDLAQKRSSPAGDALPCRGEDPELFFAQQPLALEQAKRVCDPCPVRKQCLMGALHRLEPWGVWGGEILESGEVLDSKRARGRPPKVQRAPSETRFSDASVDQPSSQQISTTPYEVPWSMQRCRQDST